MDNRPDVSSHSFAGPKGPFVSWNWFSWTRILAACILSMTVPSVYSQSIFQGAITGGLKGLGDAMQELGRQGMQEEARKAEYERQKQLMEYQQQLEIQRIQQLREYDLRQAEIERQKRIAAEAEAARHAKVTGSGFFVSREGYIVTNYHVIEDRSKFAVRDVQGRYYQAQLFATDTTRDLALLKVNGTFPGLRIGNPDQVVKGQRIFVVGYPQISIQGNESKVTDGIISSFSGLRDNAHWFQITAPVQGGNSGGPLVTEDGTVVGVVVATVSAAKFHAIVGNVPQNINYAIKSDVLLSFLQDKKVPNTYTPLEKGRGRIDAVDRATVLVIAANDPIDVSYYVSPQEIARLEKERARQAAEDAKQRKIEELAERKHQAAIATEEARRHKEEELAQQQRQKEVQLYEKKQAAREAAIERRDLAILKIIPDWITIRDSNAFNIWILEQPSGARSILDSPKSSAVIHLVRQFLAEQASHSATPSNAKDADALASSSEKEISNEPLQVQFHELGNVLVVFRDMAYLEFSIIDTSNVSIGDRLVVLDPHKTIEIRVEKILGEKASATPVDLNEIGLISAKTKVGVFK